MKVIVFAATKGGAAKTTLLFNLATYAASVGRGVLIADLDPQRSLRELWALRGELTNPRLVTNISNVAQSVAMLSSAGYDKEFLLVDTPGSMFPIIRDAVSAADLVVLPGRPNPVDLRAQMDVIDVVEKAGKLGQSLFVLTQTENVEMTEKAKQFLAPRAIRPIVLMPKRVEHARATETGKAGWELNKQCKAEIKRIWEAIADALQAQKSPQKEHQAHATRH